MYRLRQSGFSPSASQKVEQELATMHAETVTVSSRVSEIVTVDVGDGEANRDRGEEVESERSPSQGRLHRSLSAEPFDRKVVVRSPVSDQAGSMDVASPHNDLTQQPRSIMKMAATQSLGTASEFQEAARREGKEAATVRPGTLLSSQMEEFFPLGHEETDLRHMMTAFSQPTTRSFGMDIQPKEALARGLISRSTETIFGLAPSVDTRGTKREIHKAQWLEPLAKRQRADVQVEGSQFAGRENGMEATMAQYYRDGSKTEQATTKVAKGRVVRTYSRKDVANAAEAGTQRPIKAHH
jgi:hypothetical protein